MIAQAFKKHLIDLLSSQQVVLRGKLKTLRTNRTQKLEVLKAHQTSLSSPKFQTDPLLTKSMRDTLKRSLEDATTGGVFTRINTCRLIELDALMYVVTFSPNLLTHRV